MTYKEFEAGWRSVIPDANDQEIEEEFKSGDADSSNFLT